MFFLKSLQQQKQRLLVKLEREQLLLSLLPELSMNILELTKSKGRITIAEILVLTQANRNTVKKHLEALVSKNYLVKNGSGKNTWYQMGLLS